MLLLKGQTIHSVPAEVPPRYLLSWAVFVQDISCWALPYLNCTSSFTKYIFGHKYSYDTFKGCSDNVSFLVDIICSIYMEKNVLIRFYSVKQDILDKYNNTV